eukprot:TRINITY_DN2350_c0_g1_i3.p1 TRINITY_DN2350_c0_g1~~TRINITY_DN2350_c0_g1_i3.p1  ORF type:complete len:170 (-),score=44.64 TRINITY_DN2350_c0_g1_i3:149-658(-)
MSRVQTGINNDTELVRFCVSDSGFHFVFWGILIAYLVVLLLFGVFVTYGVRDLQHMSKDLDPLKRESRFIALSIYTVFLIVLVIVPILFLVPRPDIFYGFKSASLFFIATVIESVLFAYPLYRVIIKNEKGSESATASSKAKATGEPSVTSPKSEDKVSDHHTEVDDII